MYSYLRQEDLGEDVRAGAEKSPSNLYSSEYPTAAVASAGYATTTILSIIAITLSVIAIATSIAAVTTGSIGLDRANTAISDASCCNSPSGGPVDTIIGGNGITVNSSDPHNPIIGISSNFTFNGTSGVVDSVVAGTYIAVDSTDPRNPIVSSTAVVTPLFTFVTATVTAADLAGGAIVTLFPGTASDIYVADAIYAVVAGSVDFDSGGTCTINIVTGNYLNIVQFLDSVLKNFGSIGSALVPAFGATSSYFYFTVDPGGSIFAQYASPCTEYASGSIEINLQLLNVGSAYLGAP